MSAVLLKLGSRTSPLAMTQTRIVRAALAQAHGLSGAEAESALPILPINTTGDRILDRRLAEAGGKGLFTKELDEALLDGRIDVAIHSMKDVPTLLPDGIAIAAVPPRADPRDVLICRVAKTVRDLPQGAVLGTSSARRQSQALYIRPDLKIVLLRGNVDTRLSKVESAEIDATFLAAAGLNRLGREVAIATLVDSTEMPPACGQGALAVTTRSNDARAKEMVSAIGDETAYIEITAERAFLEALDGSCRTPIATHASIHAGRLKFVGEALSLDGKHRWRRQADLQIGESAINLARAVGLAAGLEIRQDAGDLLPLGD
ncbi:MAG: hydroxymethylbilane synthase [Caulobacterales bacterium]